MLFAIFAPTLMNSGELLVRVLANVATWNKRNWMLQLPASASSGVLCSFLDPILFIPTPFFKTFFLKFWQT